MRQRHQCNDGLEALAWLAGAVQVNAMHQAGWAMAGLRDGVCFCPKRQDLHLLA